jgi:hypothetical protein
MTNNKATTFLLAGVLSMLLATLVGESPSRAETAELAPQPLDVAQTVSIPNLMAKDEVTRLKEAEKARSERQNLINSLIAVASSMEKQPGRDSSKRMAIEFLGDYRASEAVDTLLSQLTVKLPTSNAWSNDLLMEYPAFRALIKIGTPSVDGIFAKLMLPATSSDLQSYAYIMQSIDGAETALYKVSIALKAPTIQEQKKNSLVQLQDFLNRSQTDVELIKALIPNRDKINEDLKDAQKQADAEH